MTRRIKKATAEAHAAAHGQWHVWADGLFLLGPRDARRGQSLEPEVVRKILKLRNEEKLTAVAIAERLGLHPNTVFKYLRLAGQPAIENKVPLP